VPAGGPGCEAAAGLDAGEAGTGEEAGAAEVGTAEVGTAELGTSEAVGCPGTFPCAAKRSASAALFC
jgi:hypothetical protein